MPQMNSKSKTFWWCFESVRTGFKRLSRNTGRVAKTEESDKQCLLFRWCSRSVVNGANGADQVRGAGTHWLHLDHSES